MAGLSERKRRAIAVLLTTPSVAAAARASNIGERTLRRWLSDPDFRGTYSDASRELLHESIGRLRATAGEAVTTLSEALRDDQSAVRVRAALGILDLAIKVDADGIVRRVAALERQQEAMGARQW